MEHCVNVAHISKAYTVDIRDWYSIRESIETVRTVVGQRIHDLEGKVFIFCGIFPRQLRISPVTFKDKGVNIESASN